MSAELHDRGWKAYQKRIERLGSLDISVGVNSEDSGVPDENGYTMADKAIINEYGSADGHIPERPAHRQTFEREKNNLKRKTAEGAKRVAEGKVSALKEAYNIGNYYAGKLRDGVQKYDEKPNAASTVRDKGFNDPLMKTGDTVNAINAKVKRRRGR